MKNFILLFVFLFSLGLSAASNNDTCKQHSDCDVGCIKPEEGANCFPKSQIKMKANFEGKGTCTTGPGGLMCGCKQQKCTYLHPNDFNKTK